MNNELDYPIKYAVLPVKEYGEYSDNDDIKGYIVSKCYVVNSILNYTEDGNIVINHDVVFPYKDIKYFNEDNLYNRLGFRFMPMYDSNNEVYPTTRVEGIYNTYEEAKEIAKHRNENRIVEMTSLWYDTKDMLKLKSYKYIEDRKLLERFESVIQEETKDLEVSSIEVSLEEEKRKIISLMR